MKAQVRTAVIKRRGEGSGWRVTDSFCGFLWEARKGDVRVDPQQLNFRENLPSGLYWIKEQGEGEHGPLAIM